MAKNQRQNQINQRIDSGQQNYRSRFGGLDDIINSRIGPVAQRSDNLFNETLTGYRGMAPKFQDLGRRSLELGGGYGEKFNKYGDEIAGYARGKLDPNDEFRMRGLGVYDELAKTGGWSDKDKANYQGLLARTTPRIYANIGREVDQANLGNFNPGALALKGRLGRQAAYDTSGAVMEGNLNLAKDIREGRERGAAGAAGTENALQQYYNNRYLGGMGLAGDYFKSGLGADAMGLEGYGRALEGEQGVYNDMRGLYGTSPSELMGLLDTASGNLGRGAGVDQGYIGQDVANNPRQKPWWQTGLEIAAPIAGSFLAGGTQTGSRVGGEIPGNRSPFDQDFLAPTGGFGSNPWAFQDQRKLWNQ